MAHPGSSRMDKDPHFSETSELRRLRKFWNFQKIKVTLFIKGLEIRLVSDILFGRFGSRRKYRNAYKSLSEMTLNQNM